MYRGQRGHLRGGDKSAGLVGLPSGLTFKFRVLW